MRGANQSDVRPEAVKAAYLMRAMSRAAVIGKLEARQDCAWLRRAMVPTSGARLTLLGIFWLKSARGPWPGFGLHVMFEGKTRTVMLYDAGAGWQTSTRMTDAVHWPQWAGRADGEPGVVNGDVPTLGADHKAAPASSPEPSTEPLARR